MVAVYEIYQYETGLSKPGEATPELALRRYESLRRKRTRHVQQRSLLIGNIGQWENRVMAGGRQVVTSMLPARIFERNLRRVYSYAA